MILVDTSAWIHLLRPDGDETVAARVGVALEQGRACWCAMIRLELWNGAGGDREKRVLREFEQALPELPIDTAVWKQAFQLARACRAAGISIPATDLLIAACAKVHGAQVETSDADFERIQTVLEQSP